MAEFKLPDLPDPDWIVKLIIIAIVLVFAIGVLTGIAAMWFYE